MYCKFRHCGAVLALVILVFSFWSVNLNWLTSKWIIIVVAFLLFIHDFICPNHGESCSSMRNASVKKTAGKTKKKKTAKKKRR
ncbi:MAG: hypothetical protein OQK82_06450 [Candidatus Pacearchaeota archaeon]|nr:hypothetical protein [Candidatus Pacearchaeota archaeon]